MKATFVFLFLTLASHSFAGGCEDRIRQFVKDELAHHPEARLIDLYKNYFQDAFGPGHLIPDTASAGAYLDSELQQSGWSDSLSFQALGTRHDFYRVNLLLVKNGAIPRDTLLAAMAASARLSRNPDIGRWKREWKEAFDVIKRLLPRLPGLRSDAMQIDQALEQGRVSMHHSEHYDSTYHPHYRIIHRSIFERWRGKFFDRNYLRSVKLMKS